MSKGNRDRTEQAIEVLKSLRDGYEIERDEARDADLDKAARYHHGKMVAIQTAIEAIQREMNHIKNTDSEHMSDSEPDYRRTSSGNCEKSAGRLRS